MSLDRACTIAMTYKLSRLQTLLEPRSLSVISIVRPEARASRFCLHCSVLRERTFLCSSTFRRSTVRASFLKAVGFRFGSYRCRTKWPTRRERPKCASVHEAASNKVGGSEILENCIEKNFHVSPTAAHKSGRPSTTLRVTRPSYSQDDFVGLCGDRGRCNFALVKNK
jgi:hypothetical protein